MRSLLTISAHPVRRYVVIAVWVAVLVVTLGPLGLAGKFSDAENNDASAYLPGSAESTRALGAADALRGKNVQSVVVVFHRDGGLTRADRRTIKRDRTRLDALRDGDGATARLLARGTSPFSAPVVSADGSTALLTGQLRSAGHNSAEIRTPVDVWRHTVSTPESDTRGLQVKVGGAAGSSADGIKVFAGINGTLIGAAGALVIVLLILIYRSPIFWLIPMIAVGAAEGGSRVLGWVFTELGASVNTQTASIMSVLVIGAGTDYALLLVSRFREELTREEETIPALRRALSGSGPAIVASGVTVVIALLTLRLASVNATAGLGLLGALSVLVAMVSMLTLLPALLAVFGRRAFWPFIPRYGSHADHRDDGFGGFWGRIGRTIARRPRPIWIVSSVVLVLLALAATGLNVNTTQNDQFRTEVESQAAAKLLAKGFPAGSDAPTDVVVPGRGQERVQAVERAIRRTPGVADVRPARGPDGGVLSGPSGTLLSVALRANPYSNAAQDRIPAIRRAAGRAGGPAVLVGGPTAIQYDQKAAATRDTRLIVPVTLLLVLLILAVLLRAIVAPVLLVATVILSFAAALGVSVLAWDHVFGFPRTSPSIPLYAFVFLVALGIDYNIFLMARVREESLRHGTRKGVLRALAATGGVITSAGIVLAGTFSVLAVLPLVFLLQIGFTVAFGVLLDTFVVRSVLVPALALDADRRIWWPSRLSRPPGGGPAP